MSQAYHFPQQPPQTYQLYQSGTEVFAGNIHAEPSSASSQSPAPSSRLVGEPAFCAGRHCCQWTVVGSVCNNHYPSAEDLDKHVATDHAGRHPNGQPSGDYHCYWAGCCKTESFGNKPKLTRHLHSHTGYKPHQCSYAGCGKGFVTKEQLRNHETTHTKTKEHICPECGKGFAVKTALTSHMNVHKGAKPYVCDECGKGFADSSNLSKHKAIHKRAALKHSHSRRQSAAACHTCPHPAPPPSFFTGDMVGTVPSCSSLSYLPDFATASIEPNAAYCGLPCFDAHCPDTVKLPCRSASPCKSVPCSSRDCEPDCIEPCTETCVEPCHLHNCAQDPCDLQDCDLPDCSLQDCTQFCGDHFDCFCPMGDETTLETPFPAANHQQHPYWGASDRPLQTQLDLSAIGSAAKSSREQDERRLSDDFKRLTEFIHGDFCNCVEGTAQ